MTREDVKAQQKKESWVTTQTMVRVGLHDRKFDYPSYGVVGSIMLDGLILFTEANPTCGAYKIPYEAIENVVVLSSMEAIMMLNNFMHQGDRPTQGRING